MSRPTWGDTVQIKDHVSQPMRPGSLASICGMRELETAEQAEQFGCGIGTTVYLVEFSDGTSMELAEDFVVVVEQRSEV